MFYSMMRKFLIILCLSLFITSLHGQTPVGYWTDNLNYSTAKDLAASSENIYISTGSSVLVYNKEFGELRKLSRVNGLTETGISTIDWSEENKTLIIAYSSTNIDLVKGNTIYNIPDISRKYIPGEKKINRIRSNGRYAYLACSFGIVVIDLVKEEIYDTWKPGTDAEIPEIWDITFGAGKVFAATASGVFYAGSADPGLSYFGNWEREKSLPDPYGKYSLVLFSGNRLYVNRSRSEGDSIFFVDGGVSYYFDSNRTTIRSFDLSDNGFTISTRDSVSIFSTSGIHQEAISSYGWGDPVISRAIAVDGDIWIADEASGLIMVKTMSEFSALTLSGPVSNNCINITSLNGKTIICGGGIDVSWNNLWRPLQISVNENNLWDLITSETISDPLRALIDPFDNDHFFVATWGGGLLEYRNNTLIHQFTEANSPLRTIIPDKPYVRICGMAMDKNKNLWITQNEVPGSFLILKPDGTWIENPLTINVPTIGDMIITQTGQKWVVLPRGNGLFVLDDNNTPEYSGDDISKKFLITDSENKTISYIYCIAEDLDGNIWVGTDQGLAIYYNPEKVFDNEFRAYRIKIPRNDGSGLADYMLGTESVTSISVDGANRKWLGTISSGAYLLSSDGTQQIRNYNESNSPLYSNSISSIAVDNKAGNIWIATGKGVISFRGDATGGLDTFTDVYSFPNPVREDYTGNVTITGLMRDTQIRITDISGNLVYKTKSDGGQASWDLTTYNGKRVATGVYMVFCASSDGMQSCVTKILIIR